jgi:hypothetical protein
MTHLTPTQALHGSAIIQALKQARVEFVLSVPDICTSEGLLRPIANDPDLRLVRVCKEDEGVSVCAALSFCAKRSVLLMQQTGLMDSANALRAIAVDPDAFTGVDCFHPMHEYFGITTERTARPVDIRVPQNHVRQLVAITEGP